MSIAKTLRNLKSLAGPFFEFNMNDVPEFPHELFVEWLNLAIDQGIKEPHAMTISTVDSDGFPDARVLILKNINDQGWYFASSSKARKGEQIKLQPKVSLTFYWPLLGRQVRIRGTALDTGRESSAKDFLARSATARAGALIERQSDVMASHDEFEEALATQLKKIEHDPNVVSPSWTLYCVEAEEVEFWQADVDRIHKRLRYRLEEEHWIREILWP